ncbi:MAG: hypothetical protein R6X18_00305 [Chloroflexota bacterium]
MRRIIIPAVSLLMLILLVACGGSAPAAAPTAVPVEPTEAPPEPVEEPPLEPVGEAVELPELAIVATDYAYSLPDAIDEGWVRVRFDNQGSEPFHVQFLRLNDGVTFEQFMEALPQGEGPAMALVNLTGGIGALAPAMSAQAVLDLPAGEYVLLSLMPSPGEEAPQFVKGMLDTLTVNPNGDAPANEPEATLTIEMADFTFDMPDTLDTGEAVIRIVNDGPEPHEWNVLRLVDGATMDDVTNFMHAPDGPPPFVPVGGLNGLDAGRAGYVEIDFEPGTYIAICHIPSPAAEGAPHSELGMVHVFTVN